MINEEKFWKDGDEIYIGVRIGDAVEITEGEFLLLQEEKFISLIKEKRSSLISKNEWRRQRYYDEVALGLEPTEDMHQILLYFHELRELPNQQGFPHNIEWPVPPWGQEGEA